MLFQAFGDDCQTPLKVENRLSLPYA